jgi:hypothetical protein
MPADPGSKPTSLCCVDCGRTFSSLKDWTVRCVDCQDDAVDAAKNVADSVASTPLHICKACRKPKAKIVMSGLCIDCLGLIRGADNRACDIGGIRRDMRAAGLCPGRSSW